ncbi:MAG: PstC family ABC transporter permease [bacterium]
MFEDAKKGKGEKASFIISTGANRWQQILQAAGRSFLLLITSASVLSVIFIFVYITKDAIPFFRLEGAREFFTSTRWYPSRAEGAEFGALAILFGSLMVTIGASILSILVGIPAAVCLSDILPFSVRQVTKPIIEILSAIPSVVYGFFALVVFAPLLQNRGGPLLSISLWLIGLPTGLILTVLITGSASRGENGSSSALIRIMAALASALGILALLIFGSFRLADLRITSGTNALNGIIILSIMALPTLVSISEDSLNAIGRELREGSYALGATRAETITRVVIPAARGGILAAVILGVMRAIGETMVVWMATGNAVRIPQPWYNVLEPIRTLTATIAGEMGEADHVTGSGRYHVLFIMALCLLIFTFIGNILTEYVISRRKIKKSR